MQPRDKTLRDVISLPEPFMEIECHQNGLMLLSKAQLRYVKPVEMAKSDQLEKRMKQLEKMDVFGVLKVAKTADLATVEAAAMAMRQTYDLDKLKEIGSPPEIIEYVVAVRKRIDTAHAEIVKLLAPPPPKALANPALQRRPAA